MRRKSEGGYQWQVMEPTDSNKVAKKWDRKTERLRDCEKETTLYSYNYIDISMYSSLDAFFRLMNRDTVRKRKGIWWFFFFFFLFFISSIVSYFYLEAAQHNTTQDEKETMTSVTGWLSL